MSDGRVQELLKRLEEELTAKPLLKQLGMTRKDMQKLLRKPSFRSGIREIVPKEIWKCGEILAAAAEILDAVCAEPEGGWLSFLFADGKHALYPENFPDVSRPEYEAGRQLSLTILRTCIRAEEDFYGFNPTLHFDLMTESEASEYQSHEEYERFLTFCRDTNLLEFLRISSEATPYQTARHIAGVHSVSMHMARQLKACGVSVDLPLMSAAAIGHDIGKFGCKASESRRVPYLHYYYTDQCLRRYNMPTISHIAANHSTWDLELENLSLESLLLIYADFRVKSTVEDGVETVHFYTLADSFDVILNKLDNVDDAKRRRYQKVYNKLVDFENFMVRKGVHTDMSSLIPGAAQEKDSALLFGTEIVDEYKDMAISHNILLMHILSHESSFTNILESARSEKDWKNTRTYLNIFREYCTYMNQRQKLMTIRFLYELMMHRESDIRTDAADLLGQMIVNYDTEYRKEIPEGMLPFLQSTTSLELFDEYLKKVLLPDHKITEQHRTRLGYRLETLMCSVLTNCRPARRPEYLDIIRKYYMDTGWENFTAFIMIHALEKIPLDGCSPEIRKTFLQFTLHYTGTDDPELQVAILSFMDSLLKQFPDSQTIRLYSRQILAQVPDYDVISVIHLKRSIGLQLGIPEEQLVQYREGEGDTDRINTAFLEDLKSATPWICKMVNVGYLKHLMQLGTNRQPMHTTIHLVNLLTGADFGDMSHFAGQTLVELAPELSCEQCNEVVMELLKSLELEGNEFSKNIPRYLGQLIVYLRPKEMDETIRILENMLISASDTVACVTLDTIGVLLEQHSFYTQGTEEEHERRTRKLWGLLLCGLAHDHDMVAQEACYVLGEYIFASPVMPFEQKSRIFRSLAKKTLHNLKNRQENQLTFLIHAAALNHIYRFVSDYLMDHDSFGFSIRQKIAFFPGTFDPFSLSHKGIVEEIRKLGFEVYLAIDEFSWSKRAQPRLIRRRIASMSTAADSGVFLFPDDISINIANPRDLRTLKSLFPDREIYIVAGSDVTANASAYRKPVEEDSIHQFSHIIFRRRGEDYATAEETGRPGGILGKVVELSLPMQLEDISSSRIRENIDLNRDISNLIDPMVQRYIYENNLYLREPQYKPILQTRSVYCDVVEEGTDALWRELASTILRKKRDVAGIIGKLQADRVTLVILRDGERGGIPVALAAAREIGSSDLYEEFHDLEMAGKIREVAWGKILLITAVYASEDGRPCDYFQLVLSELLAHYLAKEYTYCLYHGSPVMEEHRRQAVEQTFLRQGFVRFSDENAEETVMAVDMHCPYVLTKNIETVIKEPFNTNPQVLRVIEQTHHRLQKALTDFLPGNLVISFDSSIMNRRLVRRITEINEVPNEPTVPRHLGEKMCVPFGKVLRGFAAPNTVTKALHTEKVFDADMSSSTIEEYPNYSPLKTQLKMIRSFDREVILVDDLLHKGYRLRELHPMLEESGIRVCRILTGVLTAGGRDLAARYGYEAEGVYFVPNLSSWFVESSLYPFIGGDSIRTAGRNAAGLLSSVNLILPYTAPSFLHNEGIEPVFDFSRVCLENARDILRVLEQEYEREFERNLTLGRLSEVIFSPTCPDKGLFMTYNENLPATVYIENDIQRLNRLENLNGYEFHKSRTGRDYGTE